MTSDARRRVRSFGPIAGPAPLLNCTRRSVEWMAASISHPKVGALIDWQVADGMAVNVRRRLALCVHACR